MEKLDILDEILSHLTAAQTMALKEKLDASKMPEKDMEMDKPEVELEEVDVIPVEGDIEMDKVEKEMSDEELEEMIKKITSK